MLTLKMFELRLIDYSHVVLFQKLKSLNSINMQNCKQQGACYLFAYDYSNATQGGKYNNIMPL